MKQFGVTTTLAAAVVVACLAAPSIAFGDGFTFRANLPEGGLGAFSE